MISAIKQFILDVGFNDCGIAQIRSLDEDEEHLNHFLNKSYQGTMHYLKHTANKRVNPQQVLPHAKSMIVCVTNYYPKKIQANTSLKIAKYAYGKDYHEVLKEKQEKVKQYILSLYPNSNIKYFTDTGPVIEKKWAVEAGLGNIGKHSLFIHPKFGTYCFLSVFITDIELMYNKPYSKNLCISCNQCMLACPTQAIVSPYIINATKCISYNTIEHKEEIPAEIQQKITNQIYGCDICQDVCPYNTKPVPVKSSVFNAHPELYNLVYKEQWYALDKKQFELIFMDTPVQRIGYEKLMRNISIIKSKDIK